MGMGDESKESRLQSDLLSHDIRHSLAAPPKGKTGGWGVIVFVVFGLLGWILH
jgi:hypothetical protein